MNISRSISISFPVLVLIFEYLLYRWIRSLLVEEVVTVADFNLPKLRKSTLYWCGFSWDFYRMINLFVHNEEMPNLMSRFFYIFTWKTGSWGDEQKCHTYRWRWRSKDGFTRCLCNRARGTFYILVEKKMCRICRLLLLLIKSFSQQKESKNNLIIKMCLP